MSAKSQLSRDELWRVWDDATASFRASLTSRSAAEIVYDEAVITLLGEGNPVEVAIKHANALYPSEALVLSADNLRDIAEHYRCLQRMEMIDAGREFLRSVQHTRAMRPPNAV